MTQTSGEWKSGYTDKAYEETIMESEYSEYGESYERLRTDWERELWRQAVAVLDRNRVERGRYTSLGEVEVVHEVQLAA